MLPTSFPEKEVISTLTAKMLIEVEAVDLVLISLLNSHLVGLVLFILIVEN